MVLGSKGTCIRDYILPFYFCIPINQQGFQMEWEKLFVLWCFLLGSFGSIFSSRLQDDGASSSRARSIRSRVASGDEVWDWAMVENEAKTNCLHQLLEK